MTTRKLVGFGHSHIGTMAGAYGQAKRSEEDLGFEAHFTRLNVEELKPNFDTLSMEDINAISPQRQKRVRGRIRTPQPYHLDAKGRVKVLTEALERRMRHVANRQKPDALLLACMGNEFNARIMLQHPDPFDFDYPASGFDVIEGRTMIPLSLMRDQLRTLAEQNALQFWRFFTEFVEVPIFVQPPPPPIGDEAHIRSFPGAFRDRIDSYGITPLSIRAKMWRLYCDVLRETVAEHDGTTFVEIPDVAFEDGGLAKQFWQQDPTHGNRAYGRMMLDLVAGMAFPDMAEA